MTQNQIKMKITQEQLQRRFNQADLDNNGVLSSEQITKILQNVGFQDIYKGTIKKICRKINKSKGKLEGDKEPSITFQQFKQYFNVIQKPSDRFIFMQQLNRKSSIEQISQKMKDKNLFPKEKGQKLKFNWLVGEKQDNYSSTIDFNLYKHLDNKTEQKHQDHKCFFKLMIQCQNNQKANELADLLKPLWEMIKQVIGGQDQEIAGLIQEVQVTINSQKNNTVILVTTKDEYFKQYLFDYTQFLDQILKTQVTLFFNFHFAFQFQFQNLTKDKNSRIQQILARNNILKFKYQGSQFINSAKQLMLQFGVFEILYNADQYDTQTLMYLAMLSAENAQLNLKFKNAQKTKPWPVQLTNMFAGSIQQLAAFIEESEQLNIKHIFQLIKNSIKIQGALKNVKFNMSINIKELGKVFLMSLPMRQIGQQAQNQDKQSSEQN